MVMISNSNFYRGCALPSNTSNSIHKSLVKDALQREVFEINGLPDDSSSQLLPTVDPRIPTVGQHTFGEYKTYTPPIELPDWRTNRVQRESTPLQRELALEEQAAMERLRVARELRQWTSGTTEESTLTSDFSIHRNSAGFRLFSAGSRGAAAATGAQSLVNNLTQVQVIKQKLPATAQRHSETSTEQHTVNLSELINKCVNVDCVPRNKGYS